MKNQSSLGLVIEGNSTSSSVLRLPSLTQDLGPVKAGALRVSRRLSNYLRAGYAVSNYKELEGSRLILLRVPDSAVDRVVAELCASDLALKDLSFVLCESCLSATALTPLKMRGAWTATLLPVQSLRRNWFIVEGQVAAVRQVKRFLERNDARALELRPGGKPLYLAAQALATVLPVNLLASAQQALRAAGISGNHLHDLLEDMLFEMFRSFGNGVRSSIPGGRYACSPDLWGEYMHYLRAEHPRLAILIDGHTSPAEDRTGIESPQ